MSGTAAARGATPEAARWTIGAPAKVNLGLAITGRRADGYHELASVFLRIALADRLTVAAAGPREPDSLVVRGDPDCGVEGNLVLRAAAALRHALPGGRRLPGLTFTLEKRIPLGAGLAGGSADAAATLRLAAAAWGVAPRATELSATGARLGADVPFFVARHAAAFVTGIGERIAPLPPVRGRVGVLLATPTAPVATPAAFAAFDRLPAPRPAAREIVEALVQAWRAGLDGPGLVAHAAALRDANDLWPAAAIVAPTLDAVRAALEDALGSPVLLTGSGSTLVALYPSPEAAQAAAATLPTGDARLAGVRVTATSDTPPDHEGPTP